MYKEEEAIIKLKTDNNLSFSEARAELKKIKQPSTYANQVSSQDKEKDKLIETLREELKNTRKANDEFKTLLQEVANLRKQLAASQKENRQIAVLSEELIKCKGELLKATQENKNSKQTPRDIHTVQPTNAETQRSKKGRDPHSTASGESADETTTNLNSFASQPVPVTRIRSKKFKPDTLKSNTANNTKNPTPYGKSKEWPEMETELTLSE